MAETIRTIRLYGRLGAKFGRVHRLAVNSAAEAVRALCSQIKGFEAYLTQAKDRNEGYALFYDKKNLTAEELHNPCSRSEIRMAPMVMGAKKAGIGSIIAGIVVIAVSAVIDYFTGGAFGAATNYATYMYGAGLIVGGLIQLLTPVPKGRHEDREDQKPSYSFNGPINTQAQGNPVPLLYGECWTGSAVISAGISVKDQAIIPQPGAGGGYGGGSTRFNNDYYNSYIV